MLSKITLFVNLISGIGNVVWWGWLGYPYLYKVEQIMSPYIFISLVLVVIFVGSGFLVLQEKVRIYRKRREEEIDILNKKIGRLETAVDTLPGKLANIQRATEKLIEERIAECQAADNTIKGSLEVMGVKLNRMIGIVDSIIGAKK